MEIPESCTLPTAERPLRVAEFDALFAASVRGVERLAPEHLVLTLGDFDRATVEDLIARETACCSFFTFTLNESTLHVEVPAAHVAVLDSLASR
ncbi:hypothetical protein [Cryptosporangium sp. NPDC048952]|uniref:hypothetical protein n=1 Tax=Cryptosporangium sp. NPDC048952 TaxID=3363961 RepID=UPI0037190DD4